MILCHKLVPEGFCGHPHSLLKIEKLRGQLIKTFKIINGFGNIKFENLFKRFVDNNIKTNGLKLKLKRFQTKSFNNCNY